jgi:homoserine kinase type II
MSQIWVEAASQFLSDVASFEDTEGGVNNVVKYVNTGNGDRYILRVYNNGNNDSIVRFEHAVLCELSKRHLSFQVPFPLPSIKDRSTHVPLSDGSRASVFNVIPGKLPKLTKVREIGRACGELSAALSKIQVNETSVVPPYYDLYRIHHAITQEKFFEAARSSNCDTCRADIDFLVSEIESIETLIMQLHELELPIQLIHGDLHYDNILCSDAAVTGLLDFEFCAYDWRGMELAICLSKYVSEPEPLPYLQEFISGYMEHVTYADAEIQATPELVILRILSNVVFFVGRALVGEDTWEQLTGGRATAYVKRIKWLKENGELVRAAIRDTQADKEGN